MTQKSLNPNSNHLVHEIGTRWAKTADHRSKNLVWLNNVADFSTTVNEVDSINDMLNKIDDLNAKLAEGNIAKLSPSSDGSINATQPMVDKNVNEPKIFEQPNEKKSLSEKKSFDQNNIRSFFNSVLSKAKVSKAEQVEAVKSRIESIRLMG